MNAAHIARACEHHATTRAAFLEEYRPGIQFLANRVASEHPEWTEEACAAHAKVLWSCPTIRTRQDGRLVEVRNPDYQGARCPHPERGVS